MAHLSPRIGSPSLLSSVGSSFSLGASQRSAYSAATSLGSPALGKDDQGFAATDTPTHLPSPALTPVSLPHLQLEPAPPSLASDTTSISPIPSSPAALSTDPSPAAPRRAQLPQTVAFLQQPGLPLHTLARAFDSAVAAGDLAVGAHSIGMKVGQLRIAPLPKAGQLVGDNSPFAFTFTCSADATEEGETQEADVDAATTSPSASAYYFVGAGALRFKRQSNATAPQREPLSSRTKRKLDVSSRDYYSTGFKLDPSYEGPLARTAGAWHSRGHHERSAMGRALEARRSNKPRSFTGYQPWDEPSAEDSREVVLDYGRDEHCEGREGQGRAKRARMSVY